MKSIAIRDLLRKMFRPVRKAEALRPRSFRPMLERLEDRTVPTAVVSGLSLTAGPTCGGTGVTISGSGFSGATSVAFGSTNATYTVVSDTTIDALAPSESAGVVDVVVSGMGGSSSTSSADHYTYQTSSLAASSITLSSSASTTTVGTSVTFSTLITASTMSAATGTVTFMDGATTLGTATVTTGMMMGSQASFTTAALTLGSHSITAVYSGNSTYASSTSTPLTQTVRSTTAYVWCGSVSSDWNTLGNWRVNGSTPTALPGAYDDVLFSGTQGANANSSTDDGAAVSIHSLTIDITYTGTLEVNDELDVQGGGFEMQSGNIDQPNGVGVSDISVMGAFDWVGGAIDPGNTMGNLFLHGRATIWGTNLLMGSNLVVSGPGLTMNVTGTLTIDYDAGISVSNGVIFSWESGNISTAGAGVFANNGGQVVKPAATGNSTFRCILPYVSNNTAALLNIENGTITFGIAGGVHNFSAQLNQGTIHLGTDSTFGATLDAPIGLTMSGGALTSAANKTCEIIGNVKVTGGSVQPGGPNSIGELDCLNDVTMSGGTFFANVDLTANTCSVWDTSSKFSLNPAGVGTAALTAVSLHIPNTLPTNKTYYVIRTAANNSVTGFFATMTLGIGSTGTSYGTVINAVNSMAGVALP